MTGQPSETSGAPHDASGESTEMTADDPPPPGAEGYAAIEPVGSGDRVVAEGECMCSIAEKAGHFWQTLWNLDANAPVRAARKSPTMLLPGDRVTVPPLRSKQVHAVTGKIHRFRRRGVPSFLRLRFTTGGKPRANVPFTIRFGAVELRGATDGDGALCVPVPPDVDIGTLVLGEGDTASRYPIAVGALLPVEDPRGLRRRLANLGFLEDGDDEIASLEDAVRRFQRARGLAADGCVTPELRAELVRRHGS